MLVNFMYFRILIFSSLKWGQHSTQRVEFIVEDCPRMAPQSQNM